MEAVDQTTRADDERFFMEFLISAVRGCRAALDTIGDSSGAD